MKQKATFAIFIFAVGIVIAALIGYAATKEAYRNKNIEKEISALKQEAQRVKSENKALEEKIAYFDTPQFKERVAKEKLNLQKPDEHVVVINPSVQNASEQKPEEVQAVSEDQPQIPNYTKWWNYFFKY